MRFEGTYTALVTPFGETDDDDPRIDWDAFDALVDAQLAGGVQGVVPCGTTGESATLTHEEHALLIERTVKRARGRTQVIAGTGSNSTREAIAMSQHAERVGADAILVVVPYYNKPSQEGLLGHFVHVARSVKLPVVVYNIPGRTGTDLAPETLARIAEAAPNVVATKESTGNVLRSQKIVQMFGSRMAVLSGDDALTLPIVAVGGRGIISVTSNVAPAAVVKATRLALEGRREEALRAHLALLPLHEAMFLEPNPAPIKAALALRGAMSDAVRSPLARCSEETRRMIAASLELVSSALAALPAFAPAAPAAGRAGTSG
jgi:4-hydroxy-tetrahydrodipicolinate synthase